MQSRVDQDAVAVREQVQNLLNVETAAAPLDKQRVASLYGVLAQAFSILELDTDARAAAASGLKFAGAANDPVRLDLLSTYAQSVYDQAGISRALNAVDASRVLQVRGSLADTCLLITRGLLQYRNDRTDLAIANLTQAYQASTAPEFAEARIISAAVLSTVLRSMGDYGQALALNQEVIAWDTAQHATLALSVNRFLRGKILTSAGQNSAAIEEFTESRKLSIELSDTQGVAFADLRLCDARIDSGDLARAEGECQSALRTFGASQSLDEIKETQVALARIALAKGHPDKALSILNEVLDHGGTDLSPRGVAAVYQWRARANAALHNYHDAYTDLDEYTNRFAAANDAERTRQAAALRARFETDREIESNTLLKRELGASQDRSQRQARQLRLNAIIAVSGVLVIALLLYFLVTNWRYRSQLVRLASLDGLTGLPNRRRTAELAGAALKTATDTRLPLTIAIIDMDHFKIINDRCGHATGDMVLKEFARLGREALRKTDVLGRWGGEEFLLVMPEARLELAIATLERLRTLVFGIRLPVSGAGLRVSLSAGLASNEKYVRTLDELIARADSALYVAKNEGRDLVRIADESCLTTAAIRRTVRQ